MSNKNLELEVLNVELNHAKKQRAEYLAHFEKYDDDFSHSMAASWGNEVIKIQGQVIDYLLNTK